MKILELIGLIICIILIVFLSIVLFYVLLYFAFLFLPFRVKRLLCVKKSILFRLRKYRIGFIFLNMLAETRSVPDFTFLVPRKMCNNCESLFFSIIRIILRRNKCFYVYPKIIYYQSKEGDCCCKIPELKKEVIEKLNAK